VTTTDPLLAVTGALTPADQTAIELDWARVNPHHAGAKTADILDMLYQHDAHLDQLEPFADANTDLLDVPGAAHAALALIRLNRPLTRTAVVILLARAGLCPDLGRADAEDLAAQLTAMSGQASELGRWAGEQGKGDLAGAMRAADDDLRFAAAKLRTCGTTSSSWRSTC
jgi:hypothetical protein